MDHLPHLFLPSLFNYRSMLLNGMWVSEALGEKISKFSCSIPPPFGMICPFKSEPIRNTPASMQQVRIHCREPQDFSVRGTLQACVPSRFNCTWLFETLWTVAPRLLCLWDSPGKNTRVGSMPSSRCSSRPRDQTHASCVSCIGKPVPGKLKRDFNRFFYRIWILVDDVGEVLQEAALHPRSDALKGAGSFIVRYLNQSDQQGGWLWWRSVNKRINVKVQMLILPVRGDFRYFWMAQSPCFCLCLDKIFTWPCFASCHHGVRMILSEMGVLWACLHVIHYGDLAVSARLDSECPEQFVLSLRMCTPCPSFWYNFFITYCEAFIRRCLKCTEK